MKKMATILLCFLLVLGSISAIKAEEAPLVRNGSFETYENNVPEEWEIPVGTPGKDVAISRVAKDGSAALRLFGKSENAYVKQEIDGLRTGAKYILSFLVKRDSGSAVTNRIEFTLTDKGNKKYLTEQAVITNLGETELGKWIKQEIEFTVPPKTEKTVVTFRKEQSADVCFDGVEITGGDESGELAGSGEASTWAPKDIENAENLVQNESFEELENGFPKGWTPFSREKVFLNTDKEYVRTGENSVRIATKDTTLPWVRCTITENIIPGAEYELSAWICTPELAENVVFKTEHYVTNMDHLVATGAGAGGPWTITKSDGWVHIKGTDKISDNTDTVQFYFRMYGATEVYVDDLEFKLVKGPDAFNTYLTDEVFYYSDWEGNGSATATANTAFYPEFISDPVVFQVLDKEMVLYEKTIPMPENGIVSCAYPLSLLTEKMKEYTIRCSLYDENKNFIASKQETVYKVDRPGYITEEGIYVENGEAFNPIYMYGIPTGDEASLRKAKEMGVNLLQGYAVQEQLDLQASIGIKSFIVLYNGGSNGQSAGHPNRINMTINTVKQFKDHPAVFGWALMDEPTPNAWEELKRAYIEIRKIDPNHPVFITMNSNHSTTGRFTDVISSDSYPYGLYPFTTQDYLTIDRVVGEMRNRKPVYDLLQGFDYRNSYPTEQEIRNMVYQNYWAGAKGHGFYVWAHSTYDEEGNAVALPNSRLWEPLKSFYELEYPEVLDHFVYKKYPTFNEVREEDYWYRSWVKDGKLSLVLLNRKDKQNVEARVNLASADGSVKIGDFTATVVNGSDAKPISGKEGTFSVTLAPGQTILYTINVDKELSDIVSSGFFDMYEHGWAEEAVKTLNEKDILYTNGYKFYPGETVTRADFAYMLMRALEITVGDAETFADVTELDYFRNEVTAGRAAGLLNGFEDGTFGAELPISRQDLMTMCARAAEYTGKLKNVEGADLGSFTDGDMVSDYAKEAVEKMVGAGLVVGNADGTVNPQGNATRAEAAVIIARLMQAA